MWARDADGILVCGLSNDSISNDLEWPLSRISRLRYVLFNVNYR